MRNHFVQAATLLLATLLLASGIWSASLSAQLTEADLVGCYDVSTSGEWRLERFNQDSPYSERAADVLAGDSMFYEMPPRIQLAGPFADTTRVGGAWEIVVPEGALPTRHRVTIYGIRSDRLTLSFSTGYSGVIARLRPTNEAAWAGRVRTFDDYTGLQWSRRVRLTPVACDSPPPVPSSVMRSVPSAVQLVGGATIALGEPLPESLETLPRTSGALTVIGRTEGLFGTTDSIAVGMDGPRGRVGRIQLIYLDPDMSSVIARRLADAFGSPEGSALDPTGVEWRNRIRRVWLRRGARFTVNLRDYRYLW